MTRKELSFLLWLVVVIIILIFAAGCRSANSLLRHANRDIQRALAKGARADTLHSEKWDTLTILTFKDRIHVAPPALDNARIRGLIGDLSRVDSEKPEAEIIYRIRETVSPQASIDTTYNLELQAPAGKYILPITVKITASGGGIDYGIEAGALRVPVRVETNQTTITAGHGFWYDVKVAGIFLVVGALAMFILMRAGPLRNFNITIQNRKPP